MSLPQIEQQLRELLKDRNVAELEALLKTSASQNQTHHYDQGYFDAHASAYIDFTYENPTIYHVVQHFAAQLRDAGFVYLAEKDSWSSIKPGKYYTIRNGAALVAFVVGSEWTPSKGVGAIGAHIDALTVSLKPNSTKPPVEGYELLGVAPYAGTLGAPWWDRDLGVGGRVWVRKDSKVSSRLVDSTPHPVAKIPTLAPHFGAPAVGPFNLETQAVPVVGYVGDEPEPEPTSAEKASPLYGKHPLRLLRYVAKLAGVEVADIVQWDLQLYDVQKGVRGGLQSEFVFAPRVDDRVCSYAAINALLEADARGKLADDSFAAVALFDSEEIGSGTRTGVRGQLLEAVVARVVASDLYGGGAEQTRQTWANSVVLSADVNHLVNPNFAEVYLEKHKPVPNTGLALALDPNGHMATDSVGVALMEDLARQNDDKLQYFQIRNDSRSGGTIGPYSATQTGARTIDVGIPQLSMHSIRATLGAKDIGLGTKFFAGFFANWRSTYDKFTEL
ncbi:putative vacuolar aminopeptidase [Clavispora lusitaniae]|uniref:Vacuolar aminopeptidase n=3 Tax=Clavispora lusitaniae TaxID=36911 RepID=C4Y2A4_CLAL4|nr:uncharacterized protein CLUG_02667 [Clavispora lusitaniae ATCC 42720]KAF5211243.1 hypothetical protein E0198_002544 [Clavispora lusitaniae]EEQ38541.1 hypothetical protein CLUG_02667 [Clavispora lusitaniae ATCC 42720]KAF7580066.1 Aminopeptidase I zinc metalloprotease (M18) family protein [Clavispora lusitaniae]OVF08721.1 putative metalloaminopeptidase [Clavispora lusitaniae]QFZ27625.1 putative vacuolar aminopeptidase [Clavispora lusitaniae]